MKKRIGIAAVLLAMTLLACGCGIRERIAAQLGEEFGDRIENKIEAELGDKIGIDLGASVKNALVGGAELDETVDTLVIEWVCGSVSVSYGEDDRLCFSESAKGSLPEKKQMHYVLDGTKLTLYFSEPGKSVKNAEQKDLTVLLPKNWQGKVFKAELVSADCEVRLSSIDRLKTESVSGSVRVAADAIGELEAESVSGEVTAEVGTIGKLSMESVSGDLNAVSDAIGELDAENVSGDVSLTLLEDASFTLESEMGSGSFQSEISLTFSGGKAVAGTGGAEYDVESVSGDVNIRVK